MTSWCFLKKIGLLPPNLHIVPKLIIIFSNRKVFGFPEI
jgi:hypothetical protein